MKYIIYEFYPQKNKPVRYLSLLSAHKGYKASKGAILKIHDQAIFKHERQVLKKKICCSPRCD